MNLYAASAYALHLLTARSTAGHGVHSPFMFRFITEVIGGRSDPAIMKEVENLRREMRSDMRVLSIRDLGAGSVVMRSVVTGARYNSEKSESEPIAVQGVQDREEDPETMQDPSLTEVGSVSLHNNSINSKEQILRQDSSLPAEERMFRETDSLPVTERSIRQIASVAAVPRREAALLARIAGSLDSITERRSAGEFGQKPSWQSGVPPQSAQHPERQSFVSAQAVQHPERQSGASAEAVQHPERQSGASPPSGQEPSWQSGVPPQYSQNSERQSFVSAQAVQNPERQSGASPPSGQEPSWQSGVPPLYSQNSERQSEASQHSGSETGPANLPVILELGTSLGISTLALALGAPRRRVITVEGSPELAAIARENLRRHGAANAEVLNMEFSQALIYLREMGIKVGMVFIDGNHRGKALQEYVHTLRGMGDEMIMVADDIHLNRDMIQAWKSLCSQQQKPGSGMAPFGSRHADQADIFPFGSRHAAEAGMAPFRSRRAAEADMAPFGSRHAAQADLAPFGSRHAAEAGISPFGSRHAAEAGMAPFGSPTATGDGMASVETFRLGMLFCLQNITPGRYRVRY